MQEGAWSQKDGLCQGITARVRAGTESVRRSDVGGVQPRSCVRWREGFYPHAFDHRFTLQ